MEQRLQTSYTYIYGIGIDEPLLRKQGETLLYYHTNSLGSVVALTDDAGELVETVEYDVYGEPSITFGREITSEAASKLAG